MAQPRRPARAAAARPPRRDPARPRRAAAARPDALALGPRRAHPPPRPGAAAARRRGADAGRRDATATAMSPTRQAALLDSLRRTIAGLDWTPEGTEWADYAEQHLVRRREHGRQGRARRRVHRATPAADGRLGPRREHRPVQPDRRAALGRASSPGTSTRPPSSATTARSGATARSGSCRSSIDLANPSPGLGWANEERRSLLERAERRRRPRARARPPPRDRPQRAAADDRATARPPRAAARHRVRAQGRPDGPDAARDAARTSSPTTRKPGFRRLLNRSGPWSIDALSRARRGWCTSCGGGATWQPPKRYLRDRSKRHLAGHSRGSRERPGCARIDSYVVSDPDLCRCCARAVRAVRN